MARRSAVTASFSACRCLRVRVSTCLGKCEIFGRRVPTFRSLGLAYGFILNRVTLARFVYYCALSWGEARFRVSWERKRARLREPGRAGAGNSAWGWITDRGYNQAPTGKEFLVDANVWID